MDVAIFINTGKVKEYIKRSHGGGNLSIPGPSMRKAKISPRRDDFFLVSTNPCGFQKSVKKLVLQSESTGSNSPSQNHAYNATYLDETEPDVVLANALVLLGEES